MKMNKKVIVSALTIAMGAGIVGSISGTVAWYQYSTRATVQMMGTSIGVDKNLQVAISKNLPTSEGAWKTELKTADILNYLASEKTTVEFKPVTLSGAVVKDAGLGELKFKGNPRFGVANPAQWLDAATTDYAVLPLWFRSVEKDGTNTTLVEKELGMLDLSITDQSPEGKQDITKAVRIAIETNTVKAVIAKDVKETATYGKLDLDGNGEYDRAWTGYSELSGNEIGDEIVYGTADQVQTTYALEGTDNDKDTIICEELIDPEDASKLAIKGGLDLGPTGAAPIQVKLSIWLEGWQKLPTYLSSDITATGINETEDFAMWGVNNYSGSKFHIGMQFASGDSRVEVTE